MVLKRFLSLSLLLLLSGQVLPLFAFAKDSEEDQGQVDEVDEEQKTDDEDLDQEDDEDEDGEDDSFEDADSDVEPEHTDGDDEVEDDLDELEEDAMGGEDEMQMTDEGLTITSQEVDDDDLSEDVQDDLEDASESGEAPDQFYLAVMWGYFGSDAPQLEASTWDGSIAINNETGEGVFSRPVKLLMFEQGQDSIDFGATTIHETSFSSTIVNQTDGIIFKVRTDLSATDSGKVSFSTAYSSDVSAAQLADLVQLGSAEFNYGAYKVVMKVLSRDDWIQAHSDHGNSGRDEPSDVEEGAWYEKFMNFSLDNDFFSGYKDEEGQLTGEIGPGDSLTRFQTLKVLYELSSKLGMGIAASSCDPSTVSTTTVTDWMGDEWARGYVQCILDSGMEVTLLDTIDSELSVGREAALRWEVIASGFQMLGLSSTGAELSSLTDVSSSGLSEAFQEILDKAVDLGVISGYPDGTFKPYKEVNRAEMFKIVTLFYEILSI